MDGNSAKKAPVLDHLVATSSNQTSATPEQSVHPKPLFATINDNATSPLNGASQTENPSKQTNSIASEEPPQNRRTDKSQFEIELAETVNKIMHKHFEHASEQIVQQVLSEVRARLPGQRKS